MRDERTPKDGCGEASFLSQLFLISYLKDWQKTCRVKEISSIKNRVFCGAPRGFILSPLLSLITSAEREVKVSRRSGMYQSYNFLTRLGMQSL